jgi:hypothetical protein
VQGPEVFLSYKSEQHSWAARLATDLRRHGYRVFLDHDTQAGLVAGLAWEQQLANVIRRADHFLLLWSGLVTVGSYVLTEIDVRRQAQRDVTVVRLDDSPLLQSLDSATQGYRELVDLYTTPGGADAVGFFEWNRAVRHLVQQVLGDDERAVVEIPVVVVAMTRDQALDVAAGNRVFQNVRNNAYPQVMDLLAATAPFDPTRYGDRPEQWRPFEPNPVEGDPTVEQVIDDFDRARRDWYLEHREADRPPPHVFVPYSAALRDPATRQRAKQRLQERPSLVVIDPLSLVHEAVTSEVLANGLHTLPRAFVIGLGPRISSALQPVRRYYTDVERQLFDGVLMTDPHERARARFRPTLSSCVLNVSHGYELSRWVQVASETILGHEERARGRLAPAFEQVLRPGPAAPPRMGR